MSITKPYTFSAGTKARANEVNANFDTLYSQVNTNISDIAQINRDIDLIELTKADINGNSTQRFAIANPVNPTDGVNKQTLTKSLTNVLDFINGLTIEKDTNSPSDTILVNPGSCYDSTKQVVLELSGITSKKNEGQGASTTYYVHIIGNDTGTSIDILISNSQLSPTLPTGYTKFRNIGSVITDSSNNIHKINNYSNSLLTNSSYVANFCMPDYTAGVSLSVGSFTPVTNGYWIGNVTDRSDSSLSLSVGGRTIFNSFYTQYDGSHPWCFPLAKGVTYTIGGSGWSRSTFYPCIGG